WPVSFARWISSPARGKWRAWFYRRRWAAVMAISGAAPWHQGRVVLPVLGKVTATRYTDRVAVRLVSGQSPADIAKHAEALAHGFGALLCRVRSARSGRVVLEFVRRDALADIICALPIPDRPDLKALPVGRREDGQPWCIRLHGTHVLIAGATGAGKASLLWGLVRAMFPLMQAGLVRILAADPKLMRFSQRLSGDHLVLELHEDEDGFGDVADRGRADADVLHGAPALLHQREAAFALVAQGSEQRVAGFRVNVEFAAGGLSHRDEHAGPGAFEAGIGHSSFRVSSAGGAVMPGMRGCTCVVPGNCRVCW
ncbi:MAG TPA: FtsK/SpoIIIE domain-containing protein, partial [Streptosporangiaceae bacterium]|nr:FtsK/SpoIIIE domain-containing protein [Streptosporangiaceae bacterium]